MSFCTHASENHYKSFLEDFYKEMIMIRAFPKDFTNQSLLHELQDSFPDVQEYLSNMLLVFFSWRVGETPAVTTCHQPSFISKQIICFPLSCI